MILNYTKVNLGKYCFVGYCANLQRYVLGHIVKGKTWYNRYFSISEMEYYTFGKNGISYFVSKCIENGTAHPSFLFSDRLSENNPKNTFLKKLAEGELPKF